MDILGYKSGGHDGTLCYIQDGKLTFSIEAEKDSGRRHALLSMEQVAAIVERWHCEPHIICGDSREFGSNDIDNYLGITPDAILHSSLKAADVNASFVSVPHEMSHIACSYALSDLPERSPFYALVWEGYIGQLYHVDADFKITKLSSTPHIMSHVGSRYSMPYHATGRSDVSGHAAAGKIMALAGLADPDLAKSKAVLDITDFLLDAETVCESQRISFNGSWTRGYELFEAFHGGDVTDPQFVAVCKALQDGVFERFYRFAKANMRERLPLLISGGCGLNCDWNTMWRDSKLFESVFVPPVTNDCGIAVGAAAAMQFMETGRMKVEWDVYAGEEFVNEAVDFSAEGFVEMDLDYATLTDWLMRWEMVVAWIQGRYEIGPRALCHRSLIAAPFSSRTQEELNRIKRREYFRPVAPVCLEEEVSKYFEWAGPSPYMLYFQKVRGRELGAVTHVDGTARVQTVNRKQDPATYELLTAFRDKTGFGVLCNTSLNFLGCGFINRTTDIVRYVKDTDIPAFVINDKMYITRKKYAAISNPE